MVIGLARRDEPPARLPSARQKHKRWQRRRRRRRPRRQLLRPPRRLPEPRLWRPRRPLRRRRQQATIRQAAARVVRACPPVARPTACRRRRGASSTRWRHRRRSRSARGGRARARVLVSASATAVCRPTRYAPCAGSNSSRVCCMHRNRLAPQDVPNTAASRRSTQRGHRLCRPRGRRRPFEARCCRARACARW